MADCTSSEGIKYRKGSVGLQQGRPGALLAGRLMSQRRLWLEQGGVLRLYGRGVTLATNWSLVCEDWISDGKDMVV